MTTKIVLIVEYEGTHYHGFQLQANLPTIQGEIEKALWRLTGWEHRKLTRRRTRVMAASRTDAGVHARGQVVSFRTESTLPTQTFVGGLNYYLPKDIAIKVAYRLDDSFDVRRDAISREYNYYILNSSTRSSIGAGFCYLVRRYLDIEAMNQACQAFIGERDFASFASSMGAEVKNTVRRVYRAEMKKDGKLTVFNMVANSFLTHQVRNTVGTLIRVGLGKIKADRFHVIMEMKTPGLIGPTAPARGLCLMQVNYPHPFEEEV